MESHHPVPGTSRARSLERLTGQRKTGPTACRIAIARPREGTLRTRALLRFNGFVTGPLIAERRPAGVC